MDWKYIKVLMITVGVVLTLFAGPVTEHAIPPMTVQGLLVGLFFGIIGTQIMLELLTVTKSIDNHWDNPSWKNNPFNMKQPIQFFHFGGWFMTITGIPMIVLTYFNSKEYILDSMAVSVFGIGILIGVTLSMYIFKKKYINA